MKIFRQGRFRFLKQKNVLGYIIYAVGEILLVIIGILIALYVNNISEDQKKEEKAKTILNDVLSDLEDDIFESINTIEYYEVKDSLLSLVIEDKMQKEDYLKNHNNHFIIASLSGVTINDNAYQYLSQNLDLLPQDYHSILKSLNLVYGDLKANIDLISENISSYISTLLTTWAKEKEWFSLVSTGQTSPQSMQYFLKDPFYKNEIIVYKTYTIQNYKIMLESYKNTALELYAEIHQKIHPSKKIPSRIQVLLGQRLDRESIKKLQLEAYQGYYTLEDKLRIRIFQKQGLLYAQADGQQEVQLEFISPLKLENKSLGLSILFSKKEKQFQQFTLNQGGQELLLSRE